MTAGKDDDSTDDAETINLSASGGGYDSATRSVSVAVRDNDRYLVLSRVVSLRDGLKINEGDSDTFTVKLAGRPSETVTVTLSKSGDLTLDKMSLAFTTSNWSTPQTVTVSAAEDADTSDDRLSITLKPRGSGYESRLPRNLAVTVTDNDRQGLTVSPILVRVVEGGSSTYTVRLATQPSQTVTVRASSLPSYLTLSPATLTFTTSNWSTPQTVTASFAEIDSNDRRISVPHSVSLNATGGGYSGVSKQMDYILTNNDRGLGCRFQRHRQHL